MPATRSQHKIRLQLTYKQFKLPYFSGAYCHICKASKADGRCLERVKQGFQVERDITEAHLLYEYLVASGQFERASSLLREGMTYKPIMKNLECNLDIAPLHLKLNLYKFCRTLGHLVNAREAFENETPINDGSPRSKEQNQAIKESKQDFSWNAKWGPLNMSMDQAKEGAGSGGNDTDKSYFQINHA